MSQLTYFIGQEISTMYLFHPIGEVLSRPQRGVDLDKEQVGVRRRVTGAELGTSVGGHD